MAHSLSSLSLFAATPEQVLASRKRTCPVWGRGLTEHQYLTRDTQLDVMEHATDKKMMTWVLAPRGDPTTLDFKCSCETFRRRVLVRTPGSVAPTDAFGYGIASVFTPPANRRKGYARHMMRLLHWVLAPRAALLPFSPSWGDPPPQVAACGDALLSVLYSDVGAFYATTGPDERDHGWVVRDPIGTVWEVPKDMAHTENGDLDVEWLSEESAKELWKKDAELMRADMANSQSDRTLFAFRPDAGVAAFLIRRTVYFLPGQPYALPSKWGVSIPSTEGEGNSGIATFATWTLDVRPPPATLIVTRLRATKGTLPRLVAALLQAARETEMERVEVWNLPTEFAEIAHNLGGKTEARDEHLNAFKWYGTENDDEVEWLFNEKFCWC